MRRALFAPLLLLTLGWIPGCGGSSSGGGGGGGTTANAFDGQYAFVLAGFDSNGSPLGIAGSLKADGLGHITAGDVDVNDSGPGTISSSTSVTGTYAFDSSGDSTLGTITLTNTVSGVAHPLAFGFSLQASGGFGQIMSLDTNNFIAAGTMQLQSTSAFSLSGLAGDYIVSLNGRNSSNPTSALGRFTLASSGLSTNVAFDRSIAGVGTAGPTTGASATVMFGAGGPDSNGRGTFSLTLNDNLANGTQNFAYYVISSKRIVAVQTDATGTMTADFSGQSTPFTASTVVTTGGVFGIAGLDTAASNEITAVGQLQVTGAGATGGTLHWDANDAAAIFGPTTLANQALTFDPTTGRGTVTVTSGALNGLGDNLVFYLTAPGTGFLMDATAGATNRAMAGPLTSQATGPYSASTDLSGLGIVRSRGSSVNDALSLVGLFGLSSGSTTSYSLLFDQRFPSNGITTNLDALVPGISVLTLDSNVGRGTMSLPNNGANSTEVFYIIGPNQFVFTDISPVSSGVNGASSLFFVNPD
jgi:hypothetical protein